MILKKKQTKSQLQNQKGILKGPETGNLDSISTNVYFC